MEEKLIPVLTWITAQRLQQPFDLMKLHKMKLKLIAPRIANTPECRSKETTPRNKKDSSFIFDSKQGGHLRVPSQTSAFADGLTPRRIDNLTPRRGGDATPKTPRRGGDVTPRRGDVTPRKGDVTPRKSDTTPKRGQK